MKTRNFVTKVLLVSALLATGLFALPSDSYAQSVVGDILIQGTGTGNVGAVEPVKSGEPGDSGVDGCGFAEFFQPWDWFGCGVRAVLWVVLGFASLMLYMAGVLLNLAIVRTVFEFSSLVGNSEGLLLAWGILRDLGNMLLLFGFIFIGLATILDLQTYSAKKALPRLIIFAILMNFSLFAAEAVIDAANGLTVAMYRQSSIDTTCLSNNVGDETALGRCATTSGVASRLMQASGIASLYGFGGPEFAEGDIDISTSAYFGLIMLATIAAIVLFAAAIMFIVRAVTLTFLMVVAPIGFAALAIPSLEKIGKDWWSRLINQAAFAPVFLLMILVSLKITEGIASGETRGSMANALSRGDTGAMGIILVFAIVIGFLIASLMAAKKFGAIGAEFAISAATKVVTRPYSVAARAGIGGGSAVAQKGFDVAMGRARETRFGQTRFGTSLINVTSDTIRTPLEKGQKVKTGPGMRTYEEQQKRNKELAQEQGVARKVADFEAAVKEAQASKSAADVQAVEKLAQEMSDHEIAQTKFAKQGAEGIETLAKALSPEKFANFMKDKEISEQAKEKASLARYEDLRNAVTAGDKKHVRNMEQSDLEWFARTNPKAYDRLARWEDPTTGEGLLSLEQSDSLAKSKSLNNSQRELTRDERRIGRIERFVAAGNPRAVTLAKSITNSKEKARLSRELLINDDIIDTYTAHDLEALMVDTKLSDGDRRTIMNRIKTSPLPNHASIRKWLNDPRIDPIKMDAWPI